MFSSSKRGSALAPETLVKLLLLTAFFMIAAGLILMLQAGANKSAAQKYSCWFGTQLNSGTNPLKGLLPDTCSVRDIEEDIDMQALSVLMRDTWWQYGQGESDFSVLLGDMLGAARFKVSERIALKDLMQFLLNHRKGKASSMEASDYNFIQQHASGPNVCFDKGILEDSYGFVPGQDYYLYFDDSSSVNLGSDKLIFTKGEKRVNYKDNRGSYFCYSPLTEVLSTGNVFFEVKNEDIK